MPNLTPGFYWVLNPTWSDIPVIARYDGEKWIGLVGRVDWEPSRQVTVLSAPLNNDAINGLIIGIEELEMRPLMDRSKAFIREKMTLLIGG